jgi:hypothetical protein
MKLTVFEGSAFVYKGLIENWNAIFFQDLQLYIFDVFPFRRELLPFVANIYFAMIITVAR